MPFKNYRDESRTQWGAEVDESYTISREQIGLGCLLRIADATRQFDVQWLNERINLVPNVVIQGLRAFAQSRWNDGLGDWYA
jgi:hypothetical protein